jgi:hypothetical protein
MDDTYALPTPSTVPLQLSLRQQNDADLPPAVDLSHHLSLLSRCRMQSPLKGCVHLSALRWSFVGEEHAGGELMMKQQRLLSRRWEDVGVGVGVAEGSRSSWE